MGDIKQTIRIEQITDVSSTLESIKKVQEALKKLALPQDTQDTFSRLFRNLESQVEKANKAMASGFKTKSSVASYTAALTQIVNIYEAIDREAQRLKNEKISLGIDSGSFDKVNARIKELNTQISGLEKKISKLKGLQSIENLGSKTGNKVGSWDTLIKAYKEGDIDAATKALKTLKGLLTKHDGDADFSKATNWEVFRRDYETATKKVGELKKAQEELVVAQTELSAKQADSAQYAQKGAEVINDVSEATEQGAKSTRDLAKAQAQAAQESQQLNSELEHFKNKAAYFFGIANGINLLKRAIRSAYNTVKDLDAVMTETAVVTNFDVGDMWAQLPEYTQRANELGVSIHSAYEAATIFYQQGLKTNEVMAVSNETLKMARIAGLDAATASDRMTNALRGFNMEMDKMSAQRVNDVYSKLAAITASNTDEISTAMTKVASLAHNANMEFETTAAFLAQIIESTRESAETAGTALKTVVARFSEVKKLYSKGELLGTDEEGEEIDVNRVATALRSAGINLNEYLTGAKGLDDIFIELAEKWDSLDIVQQRYIATMAAGSRQQSRFIALMSDYKRTMELVDAANNANGASQEQYGKTLDSLETKLARLKNAWNEFVLGLANSDAIKGAVDLLTNLITAINKLINLISGKNSGAKMITSFFTAFTAFKIGQKAIGKSGALTGFFGKLVGDSKVVVNGSAAQIAKAFYSNLADNIATYKKNGGFVGTGQKIERRLGGALSYFSASPDNQFISDTSGIQGTLYDNLDLSKSTKEQFGELWTTVEKGNLTVGELNQALEKSGQDFRITSDNAAQFGLSTEKTAATMKTLSAAAIAAGGALMALGNEFEKNEQYKVFGEIISTLGAGLIAFGTIMSVYIPLRAQLMAREVTGAIVSIPIVGIIAGIIAAITALGVAVYKFNKNHSLEAKLSQAADAAKEAAQAATDAKEAYEKLGEAWESLEDKYDVIENATQGTQEWRDAIREVNDAVLELFDTYEGVEIKRNENGILEITNQKDIDDRLKGNALDAEAAQRYSKIREIEAEQNRQYSELGNGWNGYKAYKGLIDEYKNSGKLDELAGMTNEELNELLSKYYEGQGTYWANSGMAANEVRNYAKNYRANEEAIKNQNAALGSTIMSKAEIDKELQPYVNTILTDEYLQKLRAKNLEDIEKKDITKVQESWAQSKYGTSYSKFKANNPDDKTTADQMRDYLAGTQALEEASNQLKIFTNNLVKLTPEQKALFSGQEGSDLTQKQIRQLRSGDITKLYSDLGGDEVYGKDGIELFKQWYAESLQAATNRFDTTQFSEEFQAKLNEGLTENLTSGTYKNFVDNLWSVYTTSGAKGMEEVQNTIDKMAKEVKPDELEGFMKSINSVNWASVESIQTLEDLAKQYGVSEDIVKSLEAQIIDLNNAAAQIDLEKLNSALGLAKKVGNGTQGRSFSKEDYETAIANGVDKKDFVYNIETGNYDYIGQDIQEVRIAIENQTKILSGQLEKEVASGQAAAEAEKAYGSVNTNNEYELRAFLSKYMSLAGKNSLISSEVLNGNLGQLQTAYTKVMTSKYNLPDNEQNLEQVNASKYQLNTGKENSALAIEGDENAAKALALQITNSGLPEELAQRVISGINNNNENSIEGAGTIVDAFNQASQYGIDAEALNQYADALRQINGLENARVETLYALALANAKYQDGFKKVIESYDEWSKLKQEDGSIAPEDGNLDQLKAYEQLKKDLKEMFNLSEDISDSFLKSSENVDLMEKAVKGDTKAVSQLRANLAKSEVLNSGKIAEGVKDDIAQAIDELSKNSTDLKFGATLDDSEFAKGLAETLQAAGVAGDEMQKIFESLGWAPEVTYESVDVADIQKTNTSGWQEIMHPDGTKERVPVKGLSEYAVDGKVRIPVIGKKTSFVKPTMPSTNSNKKKGSGGGGGSKKKATYWENPYDELYNLQQKINEALRTREALERRYQKLLKQEQATLADIRKSYYAQITNLRGEADLQKQFAAGRLRQINELGNKIYTDDEGNRKTFKSLGVTKYASYNAETGLIQIDWEGLDAISKNSNRVNEGKAAEAYISKLEELVSSYEEVRDKLWDIEDEIENLREAAIESYLSFEDRVMEALVNRYQQQIDSYQSMSDAIDKANTEVIDSLREQIDLSRQIRDNTEKEKEISDMENRLAYLQRDTSGANALEVQKLQKDLDERREGYADTLVDQAIDKMQNDADLAAEQRARQIETMQEQLEIMKNTGALWQEVYDLIGEAAAGDGALSPHSNLVELLKGTEAFASLSNIGQAKWWGQVAEEFHAAWVGKGEAEDKYKTDADNDGTIYNSGTSNAITEVSTAPATTPAQTQATTTTPAKSGYTDKEKYGVALAVCDGYWGNGTTRKKNLESKGFNYNEIQGIVNKIYKDVMSGTWYGKYYGIKDISQYKMSKFKQGGLADFTGPAWLDGTKTKPEIVLNAKDSANFIALKDILASLLNNSGANGEFGGIKQVNVDINANISSDYDVDRMVERVKKDIYGDGTYRNNNSIGFLR